jgi:hypothetical protein
VETVRPLSDLLEEMEEFQRDEEDAEDLVNGDILKKETKGFANHMEGKEEEEVVHGGGRREKGGLEEVIARSKHRAACEAVDVPTVIVDWNRRIRHQGHMARLVSDVLSSSAPLLESSDERVRLAAAQVSASALRAVASIDGCGKPEEVGLASRRNGSSRKQLYISAHYSQKHSVNPANSQAVISELPIILFLPYEEGIYETVKRLYPHDVPSIFAESEKKPAKLLPQVHKLWPHLAMSLGGRLGPRVQPEAGLYELTHSLKVLEKYD